LTKQKNYFPFPFSIKPCFAGLDRRIPIRVGLKFGFEPFLLLIVKPKAAADPHVVIFCSLKESDHGGEEMCRPPVSPQSQKKIVQSVAKLRPGLPLPYIPDGLNFKILAFLPAKSDSRVSARPSS
jgi:hypothetical protein